MFGNIFPTDNQPKFAQVYTLNIEDAVKIRTENFIADVAIDIRKKILRKLEDMIRREHPYAQVLHNYKEMRESAISRGDVEQPEFQVLFVFFYFKRSFK